MAECIRDNNQSIEYDAYQGFGRKCIVRQTGKLVDVSSSLLFLLDVAMVSVGRSDNYQQDHRISDSMGNLKDHLREFKYTSLYGHTSLSFD